VHTVKSKLTGLPAQQLLGLPIHST